MQNDILYNRIMKKFLVIEITSETPEGESDPVLSITDFNMSPNEVTAPGNLPLTVFCVLKNVDNGYTGYMPMAFFSVADDGTSAVIYIQDGPQIEADFSDNVWTLLE